MPSSKLLDDYLRLTGLSREFNTNHVAPLKVVSDEEGTTVSCPDCGLIFYYEYGNQFPYISLDNPIICCGKLRR